jgi:hypothetical protein
VTGAVIVHGTDTEAVGARLLELAARLHTSIPFVATTSGTSPDGLLVLTRRSGVPTLTVDPRFLTMPRPVQDGALARMVAVLHLGHLDRTVRRRRATMLLLVLPAGVALTMLSPALTFPWLALAWLAMTVVIAVGIQAADLLGSPRMTLEADRWVADTGGTALILPLLDHLQAHPPKLGGYLGLLSRVEPSPAERAARLRG